MRLARRPYASQVVGWLHTPRSVRYVATRTRRILTLHPLWGAVLQSYAKLETFDPAGVDEIVASESHLRIARPDLHPS